MATLDNDFAANFERRKIIFFSLFHQLNFVEHSRVVVLEIEFNNKSRIQSVSHLKRSDNHNNGYQNGHAQVETDDNFHNPRW